MVGGGGRGREKYPNPFQGQGGSQKFLKSLQGHFQTLLSLPHTIWLPYHLVGIIGIKDITFFSNFSAFPQRRH